MCILLTAPTMAVFGLCLLLAVAACVGYFGKVPVLNALSFPLLLAAFALLSLGVLFRGL